MFRALLAHPQETLNKRQLVYWVRVMSVGYTRIEDFRFNPGAVNWKHARNIQSADCAAPPEDEQVMIEACKR
jgi:hypothetical protein